MGHPHNISFSNGVAIDLSTTAGLFNGLGDVSINGVAVRHGKRPMFVEIRNPWGVELCDFRLIKSTVTKKSAVLAFSMSSKQSGIMEWMLHTVRNRHTATDWIKKPAACKDTTFSLLIKPVTRTIGGYEFKGFSYQYRYQSKSMPIYKILDRSTWEIGGRATGNEFWLRNTFSKPIKKFAKKDAFSTEWYMDQCLNPNIFQFLTFQTSLQGFTFTAHDKGVLLTLCTKAAHIRSLFERQPDSDAVFHWHEHCGDLNHSFETNPMEVLFCADKLDRIERANCYESVRLFVSHELHKDIGLKPARIAPYGVIEEWGMPDFDRYRKLSIPALIDKGIKTIYVANHFENNMNVYGVSNMCCTLDYKVAKSIKPARFKAFCKAVVRAGGRIQMWGNTSISTLTPLLNSRHDKTRRVNLVPFKDSIMDVLSKSAMPFVHNPSGAIEADHYTPQFALLNLRDEQVRAYWLKCWKALSDNYSVKGFFLDSSNNLSSDKFHFAGIAHSIQGGATSDQFSLLGRDRPVCEKPAAILSMYRAHLDMVVAMQKFGMEYSSEDNGVFGLRRTGPGFEKRLDCLHMWPDCYVNFDAHYVEEQGQAIDNVFFKGLAYRVMWYVHWNPVSNTASFRYEGVRDNRDIVQERHFALFRAYNEVSYCMDERKILPGECGVVYCSKNCIVLWAFDSFDYILPTGVTVVDIVEQCTVKTSVDNRLRVKRNKIYLIK